MDIPKSKTVRRKLALLLAGLVLLCGCQKEAVGPNSEPSPAVETVSEPGAAVEPSPAVEPAPESSPSATPAAVQHPDVMGEWHRTDCHSEHEATVTISEQTAEGFTVEADCRYGAHMGQLPEADARFTGETSAVMEVYGDYEYRSETGPKPPVEFVWEGDTMTITTEARDFDLGFGANVYIQGTYTRGTPEYTNAGQLDRLLSPAEQERLRSVAGESYDWNVAQVLGSGTISADTPCRLADGRTARYISAWYSPNWGESLEIILAEDGRTYCKMTGDYFCTDDPVAAKMPEVVWPLEDDTHDYFTVPTGGRLGTVVVTVEREEGAGQEWADLLQFSVWDPAHMDTPIQRMEMETNVFHRSRIVDANFDGYMDFGYMYAMGNQPCYSHFWLWDENQEQFVEEPLLAEISCPEFDQETGIIDGYARDGFAGLAGRQTFHRWIDGALICIRKVQTYPEDGSAEHFTLTVEETVNGTLTEVFRKTTDAGNILDEALKWHDLAYHGEP